MPDESRGSKVPLKFIRRGTLAVNALTVTEVAGSNPASGIHQYERYDATERNRYEGSEREES